MPDGQLQVTDAFLAWLLQRPELAPVAESCPAELALHTQLIQSPRREVGAQELAAFADREYFEQSCKAVIDCREQLVGQLEGLGFEVLPSAANFIFARHPEHDAAALAAKLRLQGVIVRHFKQLRIDQFLRITIGTPEQNAALIEGLSDV